MPTFCAPCPGNRNTVLAIVSSSGSHAPRPKQVRRKNLTRDLLMYESGIGEKEYERTRPGFLAAAAPPAATGSDAGCPCLPPHPGGLGVRCGPPGGPTGPDAVREPPEHLQLGGRLHGRVRPRGAGGRRRPRTSAAAGRRRATLAGSPPGGLPAGPRLPARELDGAVASGGAGERHRATGVR
jgi:hypothetical protein